MYEPLPKGRAAFLVRIVKYYNKLPVSVVTAPTVGESLDKSLSPSPPIG